MNECAARVRRAGRLPPVGWRAVDRGHPPLTPLPRFRVSHAQRGRVRVVEVDGDVDMLTAPALAGTACDDGSFDGVVLDLANVRFMSLTGVRVIFSLSRMLSRRGGGVALACVHRDVARVLEMSGLAGTLLIADDVPAAVRLLETS